MAQPAIRKAFKPKEEMLSIGIQSDIQALAYQLWLERGAPIGSPEQDWLEAEARLAGGK